MSSNAWIMMIATWAIVIYFSVLFFLRVLFTPTTGESDSSDPESND